MLHHIPFFNTQKWLDHYPEAEDDQIVLPPAPETEQNTDRIRKLWIGWSRRSEWKAKRISIV